MGPINSACCVLSRVCSPLAFLEVTLIFCGCACGHLYNIGFSKAKALSSLAALNHFLHPHISLWRVNEHLVQLQNILEDSQ